MAIKTLSELNKVIQDWATKETQVMQLDLFTSIRDETPVDTGRAQRGWTNAPIAHLGETGIIDNEVPYIGWLEFGSDTVAPTAMVRRNITRVTK